MESDDIKAKLLACKTGLEIKKLRKTLDSKTAKKVFESLDPLDQMAISTAKFFSAPESPPGRWDPSWVHVDSSIVDP